jgi:hypothetical protein
MVFLSGPVARLVVAAVAAVTLASASAGAQRGDSRENPIKAAFLYNFTKFIEWPKTAFAAASTPFTVCAFADGAFRKELDSILRDEQVQGHPIVMAPTTSGDVRSCHLAYFSRAETDRYAMGLSSIRQTPVLTIGEGMRFLEQGGLIAFLIENDRVRFAISKRGAEAAGLTVSSKLLRVARPFDGSPGP